MDAAARPARVLILGGSSEASALARAIAARRGIAAILSLAGRTKSPLAFPIPTRVGGFGGAEGLAAYLRAEAIAVLVDATHPFAARMSDNARRAAAEAGVPLVRLTRAGWRPEPGDDWREVADLAAAAAALGATPRRVFLTVGRLGLAAFEAAPWHHYLVRTIDPVEKGLGLPDATFIAARGPFEAEDEARLMRAHGIDVLVTKNSGGAAAVGKLIAARALRLPVILTRRPGESPDALGTVAEALDAIEAHRDPPAPRGV